MNNLYKYIGYILLLSIVFRILPIVAGIIYGESIFTFILSSLISLIVGLCFLWLDRVKNPVKSSREPLNLVESFMLVAITFILIPLISAISFLPSFNYNLLNAFFESISGFTTTGLTLYSSLVDVPYSLLLWRAETQWIGGIGIIMVFLFLLSRIDLRKGEETTHIETTSALYKSQGLSQKLEASLQKSSRNIIIIYGGYTLAGILFLYLSGMSFFESISLSFTSISTGGFIVTDSLGATTTQLIILSVLMLLGSISFIAHNKLIQRKFKEFFWSFEKNVFMLLIASAILITFMVYDDIKIITFELISAFTTTGYSITAISLLPHLFIFMIITGMLIGGSVASTSGGMKTYRIYTLLAMIPWMFKKIDSPPHAIIPLKINSKVVEENDLFVNIIFITSFLSLFFTGTIIFLLLGYSFLDSSFQIASALGTVGLQTVDLLHVPVIGKIILILGMLIGRLEIFPLAILLKRFWKL